MTLASADQDHALDEATARSVIARIVKDEDVSPATAERWLAEALRFLNLAAEMRATSDARLVTPSAPVDAAWHAFILHTRPYAEYCERAYGGFVHHSVTPPIDPGAGPPQASGLFSYLLTRVLMRERYGELDEELWPLS